MKSIAVLLCVVLLPFVIVLALIDPIEEQPWE